MISESKIVVRYAETDKMGVVYHANYLVWFEIGRTDFLDMLGYPYKEFEDRGILSPVLQVECKYGTPLRYGESALVQTKLLEVSAVKSAFSYEIFRYTEDKLDEKPCCTGLTRHCLVEEGSFKPLSMKKHAPELYSAYLSVLEASK